MSPNPALVNASELRAALAAQRPHLRSAIFFGIFTNLLVMAPTLYMLEVYDRVVSSRSGMTLAMLTLAVVALHVLLQVLDWVRAAALQQAALGFDARIASRLFDALFEARLRHTPGATTQVFNDLRTLRDFIGSAAPLALLDVPLALLYVLVIFAINPIMGWMAIVGALVQVLLAWLTERNTQAPLRAANRAMIGAQEYVHGALRNAEVIAAMGMQPDIHRRWLRQQQSSLSLQASASDQAGAYAALSRFMQMAQGSLLLGAGCWLTINGLFPGGGGLMIVASILGGRLLTPIVQSIAMWRQVANAGDAYLRLDHLLRTAPARQAGMSLPPPRGTLSLEGVVAAAPGSNLAIIRGISLLLPKGQVLAILGPSASGKTTLARLMVGVWPAASGKVRLDGVDVYSWSKAELGPHVGYMPQEVELFDGNLAENIARFGPVDMAMVETAARAVGLHEIILAMPRGYATQVGEDGALLSGGQRQRVALARALYGEPSFVVLDEPNSHLDEAGEQALLAALLALKGRGATVVLITHRISVLPAVDLLLLLQDGQAKAYGPRDEILAALQRAAQAAAPGGSAPAPAAG